MPLQRMMKKYRNLWFAPEEQEQPGRDGMKGRGPRLGRARYGPAAGGILLLRLGRVAFLVGQQ